MGWIYEMGFGVHETGKKIHEGGNNCNFGIPIYAINMSNINIFKRYF